MHFRLIIVNIFVSNLKLKQRVVRDKELDITSNVVGQASFSATMAAVGREISGVASHL